MLFGWLCAEGKNQSQSNQCVIYNKNLTSCQATLSEKKWCLLGVHNSESHFPHPMKVMVTSMNVGRGKQEPEPRGLGDIEDTGPGWCPGSRLDLI